MGTAGTVQEESELTDLAASLCPPCSSLHDPGREERSHNRIHLNKEKDIDNITAFSEKRPLI